MKVYNRMTTEGFVAPLAVSPAGPSPGVLFTDLAQTTAQRRTGRRKGRNSGSLELIFLSSGGNVSNREQLLNTGEVSFTHLPFTSSWMVRFLTDHRSLAVCGPGVRNP